MKIWCILVLCLLFFITPFSLHASTEAVDSTYESLYHTIKSTPLNEMTLDWLVEEVYIKHDNPQKYLKKILSEFPDASARMGRLRQAMDLMFWINKAEKFGWTIELTNQGKTNGHQSDLDQTGWVLIADKEGKLVKRGEAFRSVKGEWIDYLENKYKISPEKPDMTIFSGDEFLPDYTNAKTGSHAYNRALAEQLIKLRADGEAYWVPGANKAQVHNRALAEGRTIHITWHDGKAYINGKPFDIDKFINNETGGEIFYLPTSVVAERYRSVKVQRPHRQSLGNTAENCRRYLEHLSDPLNRQKYGNRWWEAIKAITGAGDIGPQHEPLTYMLVHRDAYLRKYGDPKGKLAPVLSEDSIEYFKKKAIGQAFGFDPEIETARYERIKDIIDRSMNIELDKVLGVKEPFASRARLHFEQELEAVKRIPYIEAKDQLKAAEELFVKKHLEVLLEGTPRVLKHALEQDFTKKGRNLHRSDYGQKPIRMLRKLYAEKLIEIAGIFEAVEAIGSREFREHSGSGAGEIERLRETVRQRLLNVPNEVEGASPREIARMRRVLNEMALLAKYQAIDIWLEKMAETGRPPSVEEAIARKRGWIEEVESDIEKKAATIDDETARQRAMEWTVRKMGASKGETYGKTMEMFRQGINRLSAGGKQWIKESLGSLGTLVVTNTALNLIQTYQQDCILGGKTDWDCGNALVWQGAYDMLFMFRYVGELLLVGTSLYSISEGNIEGFIPLTLGTASFVGYPAAMHYYFMYHISKTFLNVTYGFTVALHENDLINQAFRSFPQPGQPAKRSGDATITADTPNTPIMWEVDVPANHWSWSKKRRVAREQFGAHIVDKLVALNLKPNQSEWKKQGNQMLHQFTFDLPYYQRMSIVYEHFSSKIKRYVEERTGPGSDMSDMLGIAFDVFDVCVEHEIQKSGEGECSTDRSMYPKCLARAMQTRSPELDDFFNEYLEGWLAKQYESHPGYRDNFYTLWERMYGGEKTKIKIFRELRTALLREYILGEYRYRKSEDMLTQLKCALMEAAKLAEREAVLNKAIIAGQNDRNEEFGDIHVSAYGELYEKPVTPVTPEITLNLPEWAVRQGEKAPVEVEVRGEFDTTVPVDSEKNQWRVEYIYTIVEQSLQEGRPDNLIMTQNLSDEIKSWGDEKRPKFVRFKVKVTAVIKNELGETLGTKEGFIQWYDVFPDPKKKDTDQEDETEKPTHAYYVVKFEEEKGYTSRGATTYEIGGYDTDYLIVPYGESICDHLLGKFLKIDTSSCQALINPVKDKDTGRVYRPTVYTDPSLTIISGPYYKYYRKPAPELPEKEDRWRITGTNGPPYQELKEKYCRSRSTIWSTKGIKEKCFRP